MDQRPSNPDPARSADISPTATSSRSQSNANSKARRLSSICSTRDLLYVVEKRPTFGQWIKVTWLDILTIVFVGALAFPVYYYSLPLGVRVFPLDVRMDTSSASTSTSVIPPDFAYPARPQTVSNWLIATVAIAFPIIVILLIQIRIRSFWDLNNAFLGFLYALSLSSAFQAITKAYVGGFRPNFYDICQPDSDHARDKGNRTRLNGIGFRGDMWTVDVCTTTDTNKLRNAMQGFPSGHTTTMVAAMVFLCLYLNAKLKVFANYHTPLWKLVALILPLLGAVLLCGTLIIDHTHSWYDIAGGATIGTLMAFAAFRMVYPSIFDWRINHIPLNRNVPFDGCSRPEFAATTRAGWRLPVGGNNDASGPNSNHEEVEMENDTGLGNSRRVSL
ncbi:PAP2 superfamily-domain-containing protein [Xylaria telfairii]|nr:PAP2 superfamily-domain-containing protein [Xylaria telfairii]